MTLSAPGLSRSDIAPPSPTTAESPTLTPARGRTAMAAARYQTSGAESVSNNRLVVMLFERLLRDLDGAEAAVTARQPAVVHTNLIHAQQIIEALQRALDTKAWEGGTGLFALYEYCTTQLVQANVSKSVAGIEAVRSVIAPLLEGWQSAWQSANTLQPSTP